MKKLIITICLLSLTSCTAVSKFANPFYEEPSPIALKGELNDNSINPVKANSVSARSALSEIGTKPAANAPQPYNPVYKPALIRLMWVPDHLNKFGDMVPSHYYYLKVKDGDWALNDAFELEAQLGSKRGTANLPFVRGR